jgi:hypothetical protein
MTDIDVYKPAAGLGQYQAGIVMTPESAKALDDQVRRCTEAVLREGTDYGVIPGTSGEKTLWRPGAQKLLQWFGLGYTCERVEVEHDDDGRKHGITYKCTVGRRLPDGTIDIKATCEGTADYDESKFYQTAGEVQRKAEDRERAWAEKDKRPPRPTKWQGLPEYRADWNALMKRAQKRAIVGAVVDATAAGGIFTDREEDDSPAPPPEDDGPSWYEQALEDALTFTDKKVGWQLYRDAQDAYKTSRCNRRQMDHVQNRIKQRDQLLKNATPVDAEDLATQAARLVSGGVSVKTAAAGDDTRSQRQAGAEAPRPQDAGNSTAQDATPRAAGAAPDRGAQPLPPLPGEDEPDAASDEVAKEEAGHEPAARATSGQLTMLGQRLGKLGVEDENRLSTLEKLAGRDLTAPADLTQDEAAHIRGLLDRCKGDRGALVELLATGQLPGAEQAGDGDE